MIDQMPNRLHNALIKLQYLYRNDVVTKEDIDRYYGKIVNHLTKHNLSAPSRLTFDMMLYNQLRVHSAWDALEVVTKKCIDKGKENKAKAARA